MKTEWSNKDSLEIPETTAGYGSVSWSDYKTGTSCDSVRLPTVKAITVEWIEKYKRIRGWEVTVTTQNAIDNMLNAWEKENE